MEKTPSTITMLRACLVGGLHTAVGTVLAVGTDVSERDAQQLLTMKRAEAGGTPKAKRQKADKPTRADLDAALATLPGEEKDPDYVVRAMRSHFGAVFTEADEAKVRDLVKKPATE